MKRYWFPIVLICLLSGCMPSNVYYDFYPTRTQALGPDAIEVVVEGTWIDSNTYSSPYQLWLSFSSKTQYKELTIIDAQLLTPPDKQQTVLTQTKTIIAADPKTVLRDNELFSGRVLLGLLYLQHQRHELRLKLSSGGETHLLTYVLKPLYREEEKSIRAILAN